jgi:hypothetical protein
MARRSKEKGKRGEREAAAEIARLFGAETRRGVQYTGGHDSPDIVTSIPDVHFEVKRRETLRLWEAIDQATSDAAGKIPVVLHRPNARPWLAIVPLDQLPRLATTLYLSLAQGA